MKIDAHHHFWNYNAGEYAWISGSMGVLRKDYLPETLAPELEAAGIDGVVSVQARQSLKETEWLLDLAAEHDFIKGVVGWVPLVSPEAGRDLDNFAPDHFLKAVRHVLHDEPGDDYVLRADFNAGVGLLESRHLAYDILIFERHLRQTIQFVDMHPQQIFVLDHLAKPKIKDNEFEPWRKYMRQLAERENVYCKISGMAVEADHQAWTPEQLKPYYEITLEAFGPRRLMFGTDWPVCLLACEYRQWSEIVRGFVAELSDSEQQRILGETAVEAYHLE